MTATISKADRAELRQELLRNVTRDVARVLALFDALDGALDSALSWRLEAFRLVCGSQDAGEWLRDDLLFLRDCLGRVPLASNTTPHIDEAVRSLTVRTEGGDE